MTLTLEFQLLYYSQVALVTLIFKALKQTWKQSGTQIRKVLFKVIFVQRWDCARIHLPRQIVTMGIHFAAAQKSSVQGPDIKKQYFYVISRVPVSIR